MKKTIAVILLFALLLTACGETNIDTSSQDVSSVVVSSEGSSESETTTDKKNEPSVFEPSFPIVLDKESYTPEEKLVLTLTNDTSHKYAFSYERIDFFNGEEWVVVHSDDGVNTFHEHSKEDFLSGAIYFEPQEVKTFDGIELSAIDNPVSGKYRVSYLMGEDAVDGNGNDVISIICNIFVEFTLTVE